MADEPTHPAGVPVIIALAYHGDQQDHTRIGRIEYHPRGVARRMVADGEARWPDDLRNVDDGWPIRNDADEGGLGDEADDGPQEVTEEMRPLAAMSKSELRAVIPGGADLPDTTTRNELLAYARAAQQSQAVADPAPPGNDQR